MVAKAVPLVSFTLRTEMVWPLVLPLPEFPMLITDRTYDFPFFNVTLTGPPRSAVTEVSPLFVVVSLMTASTKVATKEL